MRESREDRNSRLKQSGVAGRALLAELESCGTSAALARKAGVESGTVARWIAEGKISMRGATGLAEATGRDRKEFRPDLSDEDWNRAFPGPVPGRPATNDTEDAKLLVSAAQKQGCVSSLCRRLGISVANFHTWKTRGKIPAAKRPNVEALAP